MTFYKNINTVPRTLHQATVWNTCNHTRILRIPSYFKTFEEKNNWTWETVTSSTAPSTPQSLPDHQSPFFSFLVLVLFLLVRVTGHRNFKKTLENITERGEKRRRGKSTSAPWPHSCPRRIAHSGEKPLGLAQEACATASLCARRATYLGSLYGISPALTMHFSKMVNEFFVCDQKTVWFITQPTFFEAQARCLHFPFEGSTIPINRISSG